MDTGTDSEIIFVVEETDEGVYIAHALGHSIFTEADTFEELRNMIREVVQLHFDDEEEEVRPRTIQLYIKSEDAIAV